MEDKKLQLPEYEFQYGYTDRIINLNIKSEDNSAMSMKYSFIPSIFRDFNCLVCREYFKKSA